MGSRTLIKEMKYHSWMINESQKNLIHKNHQAENVGKNF